MQKILKNYSMKIVTTKKLSGAIALVYSVKPPEVNFSVNNAVISGKLISIRR